MTTIPVELRELLERAASLITEMSGGIRSADEYGDFSAECDDAEEFASELRALLAEQPQAGAGQSVLAALDWVDDFVARCNGDDRGSCESVNTLRQALTAPQPPARHDQANEVRRLREALESARSHCVTWQGEPHEYSCSVHKAVIGVIDAALTHSQKGEEE